MNESVGGGVGTCGASVGGGALEDFEDLLLFSDFDDLLFSPSPFRLDEVPVRTLVVRTVYSSEGTGSVVP